MIVKKKNLKAVVVAIFCLAIGIFLLGGGNNRARFLASLGLAQNPPGPDGWQDFESATAVSLASEALEAMRTIRFINSLKYPDNGGACWLMLPEHSRMDECVPAHLIQDGLYALEYSIIDPPWKLKFIGLDDGARLNLSAGDAKINEQYRVHFIPDDAPVAVDVPAGTDAAAQVSRNLPTTTLARPENDAVFFRMLQIQIDKTSPPQMMNVTSTVQWKSGGQIYKISLDTRFANYQKLIF